MYATTFCLLDNSYKLVPCPKISVYHLPEIVFSGSFLLFKTSSFNAFPLASIPRDSLKDF